MKKLTSVVLIVAILMTILSFNVAATNDNTFNTYEKIVSETTEYFKDGSSITTTVTQIASNDLTRATKSITGSKTKTIKDSAGDVLYKFKVTGTFTVNEGVSSTCTAVSCSASNCNYGWELDSSTTSKSGNTAKAVGIFKKKTLFITTQTVETTATLTCDKNGVLS